MKKFKYLLSFVLLFFISVSITNAASFTLSPLVSSTTLASTINPTYSLLTKLFILHVIAISTQCFGALHLLDGACFFASGADANVFQAIHQGDGGTRC